MNDDDIVPAFVLPKALFFVFLAAAGSWGPFRAVYFESCGLSGHQIGLIGATRPWVQTVATFPWAALSDTLRRPKLILVLTVVGGTAAGCSMIFLRTFWGLLIATLISSFFMSSVISLLDAGVLQLLGKHKASYGKQRLWGAVSWGMSAPTIGFIVDRTSLSSLLIGYGIGMAVFVLLVVLFYPSDSNDFEAVSTVDKEDDDAAVAMLGEDAEEVPVVVLDGAESKTSALQAGASPSLLTSVATLLCTPGVLPFLLTGSSVGMGVSVITNYLFLFLGDRGASKTLMGFSITFTVALEIPFFFFSKRMMATIGTTGLIVLGQLCYILRVILYTFLPLVSPWWVLAIEPLHGVTYACFQMSAVAYMSSVAPPGLDATAQGLYGIANSLGSGIGAIIGGVIYEFLGPVVLFRSMAGMMTCSLIFFATCDYHLKAKTAREAERNSSNEGGSDVLDELLDEDDHLFDDEVHLDDPTGEHMLSIHLEDVVRIPAS